MNAFRMALLIAVMFAVSMAQAELRLPALFTDGMVLQREMETPVWGWAAPGAQVTVELAEDIRETRADDTGRWRVQLPARPASSVAQSIRIRSVGVELMIHDVLVGEVWVCSGQSNMAWPISRSLDPDLESIVANFPHIRYLRVPPLGTQALQWDFDGQWEVASPATVPSFPAVGFLFARWIHEALDVPVGLIHNAWGGSAAESWIRRDVLEADGRFEDYLDSWRETEATYDHDQALRDWQEEHAQWRATADLLRAQDKRVPPAPRQPRDPMTGQQRPGNCFAGVLNPVIGYGIRGVIWYQGEANSGRAWHYLDLFPLLIRHWRQEWGQGDFPFYWVQLTGFRARVEEPGESTWAELREAQTMTLSLPNTGQAITYDLGEARDIHPRDKQNVARRLARIALARDYGFDIPYRSPTFISMRTNNSTIEVDFTDAGDQLYSFDVENPRGFAIAGADRRWQWAYAVITGPHTVVLNHPEIPHPVAVRYAWSDNPDATLRSAEQLPVTPFRTDDWPLLTQPAVD